MARNYRHTVASLRRSEHLANALISITFSLRDLHPHSSNLAGAESLLIQFSRELARAIAAATEVPDAAATTAPDSLPAEG
jgi:hypothetical protein